MIIHKGNKYIIESDGVVANKSDGKSVRSMRFYPERDANAIAGEIDELTAWQLIHDIAAELMENESNTPISPDHILIDGDGFVISQWSQSVDARFVAPEGYNHVWALAASVFYIFLGCHVFQGLGGKGQTRTAPIPVLRRELHALSNLISKCLAFDPSNRPNMSDLLVEAKSNIARCLNEKSEFPPLKSPHTSVVSLDDIDRYWPDKMY